ncbi:MAG: multidrug effflux MFS transporter [Chthoniobacterales bacterium]|nr:multidrug effflux MFS transporter [Chthoniobacterales bacterium]
MISPQRRRWIIVLMGLLTALSPFTLDMYLPAFSKIAADLGTTTAHLAWTLSSNFIGIGLGQLFYGPLLDRFGRKKPLYVGLIIYIIASLACMASHSLEAMIFWRFVLGLGGCVACVVAYATVRDLFPSEERATIFSVMILVMGASPLLAPSVGNLVALLIGWQAIFAILSIIALCMMVGVWWLLPPVSPDTTVRLHPWHIGKDYLAVFRVPAFYRDGLSGAISFAALFAYVAGSPLLFLSFFQVTSTTYSWIFTVVAAGFIFAGQLNIWLLRYFKSGLVLRGALAAQMSLALLFLVMTLLHLLSLSAAIVILFLLLAAVSIAFANATVLAMAPFGSNAGRASALISVFQMFFGTLSSMSVGAFSSLSILPMALVILVSSLIALVVGRLENK